MPDIPAADWDAQNELPTETELPEIVEVSPRKSARVGSIALDNAKTFATETSSPSSTVPSADGSLADEDSTANVRTDAQQPATRRNLISRCRAVATSHVAFLVGGAACLLLGVGMGYLAFGHPAAEASPLVSNELNKNEVSSSVRFGVATKRRNEPLKPILPFDDLDQAVVDIGRRLFHEPALSGNGRMSCANCHSLAQAGTSHDALPRGTNGQKTKFNPPSVLNAALNFAYGWEGRFATLEEQLDDPITRPDELGASWDRVLQFLSNDAGYRAGFIEAFGGEPTRESVATALASYERSLLTPDSQFDQWLAGDEGALNGEEFGGYFLFKKYGCVNCHQGAGVGGSMFQPLGVAKTYFESASDPTGLGRFAFTERERDRHVFRVPALRNVAATAPYLHDGRAETLEAVVAVMLEFQCGETVNSEDVRRLTAFLKTLSGKLPAAL